MREPLWFNRTEKTTEERRRGKSNGNHRAEASNRRGSSLRSMWTRTTLGISEEQATRATKLAEEIGETLID